MDQIIYTITLDVSDRDRVVHTSCYASEAGRDAALRQILSEEYEGYDEWDPTDPNLTSAQLIELAENLEFNTGGTTVITLDKTTLHP